MILYLLIIQIAKSRKLYKYSQIIHQVRDEFAAEKSRFSKEVVDILPEIRGRGPEERALLDLVEEFRR